MTARQAELRCRAYQLFAEALAYPDAEFVRVVQSGRLADRLREVLEELDPKLLHELSRSALSDPGDGNDLAVEYTRLFDVGASGPPCPLHGGLYGAARMKTMEEDLRFYNYFGLALDDEERELPDHLAVELEFLHYLAFCEVEALRRGEDHRPYHRAQRDFIERHPGRWVPMLRERLERQNPMRFFLELIRSLERFLQHATLQLARRAERGEGPATLPLQSRGM
jgi:DMSO reductase family type II enzyme chaperone